MEATIQHIEKELTGLYPKTEVKAFTRLILEHVCGLSFTEQVMLRKQKLDERHKKAVYAVVERLKNDEPVQYILGETEFFGMKLKVKPAVLIPRPETEELAHWIAETVLPEKPAVIDMGTGSGCLALAIKKQFPQAQVSATDLSAEALEVARENAALNALNVHFFRSDMLHWGNYKWDDYDVVVSNPPYVRESEKTAMLANVLKYEPESALFVPDANPLLFYREIASFAQIHLKKNGWLFFEINENLGKEMVQMLENSGFTSVEVKKDVFGKNRMVRCRRCVFSAEYF
jgi:release factor glutamine methyltransferase